MSTHEWFVENRIAFITRALDAGDARTFAEHLARCPECQAGVTVLEQDLSWLPLAVQPVRPRPGFRRQIAQAVFNEPGPTRRQFIAPVAIAASLLIASVATFGGYLPASKRADALASALEAQQRQIALLQDTLSVMRESSRVLQASIASGGQQGGLLIFADERTHRWNVVMHGLPKAPTGKAYQFWFIAADGMVRGVTIDANPSKPTFVTLEMPPTGGAVMGAALTLEPMDSPSSAPRGRELAHLML